MVMYANAVLGVGARKWTCLHSRLQGRTTESISTVSASETSSRVRATGTLANDLANVASRARSSMSTSLNIPEFEMALMLWGI